MEERQNRFGNSIDEKDGMSTPSQFAEYDDFDSNLDDAEDDEDDMLAIQKDMLKIQDRINQQKASAKADRKNKLGIHSFRLSGEKLWLAPLQGDASSINNRRKVTVYLDNELAELLAELKELNIIRSYSLVISEALKEYLFMRHQDIWIIW